MLQGNVAFWFIRFLNKRHLLGLQGMRQRSDQRVPAENFGSDSARVYEQFAAESAAYGHKDPTLHYACGQLGCAAGT